MGGTVGVILEREHQADVLWNQCDAPGGSHASWRLVGGDPTCDRLLVFGTPVPPEGSPRRGLGISREEAAWKTLARDPSDVTVLFYEPPPLVPDSAYAAARRHASRVFGPDERATDPLRLPAMWTIEGTLETLRDESPADKPIPLACVTSGKRMSPGHEARLSFLERCVRTGVDIALYGRGLDDSLGGRGPVANKGSVLRAARLTLAIENYDQGDLYVTEKLWDALACWSLPIYYGPGAPESMIPEESFVRLPDLGERGVRVLREVMEDESLWSKRLEAIGEARRLMFGDLRLVEWYRREVLSAGSPVGRADG